MERDQLLQLEGKMADLMQPSVLPQDLSVLVNRICHLQLDAVLNITLEDIGNPLPEPCPEWKHAMGMPLLPKHEFLYSEKITRKLLVDILDCLEGKIEPLAGIVRGIRSYINLNAYCRKITSDQLEIPLRRQGGFSPALFFRHIVWSAMAPSLFYVSVKLAKQRKQALTWAYGGCPICGSMPIMHYWQHGQKHACAVCSFCSYEYLAGRDTCPACMGRDTVIKVANSEDETWLGGKYSFMICNGCGHYMKIARQTPQRPGFFAITDDLKSLPLDNAAAKMKLSRLTLSPWTR